VSNSKLPERASLEYLKKQAKDRLAELRHADPQAKLATALLDVARSTASQAGVLSRPNSIGAKP